MIALLKENPKGVYILMKLLIIKIDTSHEVEDALGVYAQDNLNALGI